MLNTVFFNCTSWNYQPWEEKDKVQKQKELLTGSYSLSQTYTCWNFDVYTRDEPEPYYLQKILK